MRRPKSRRLHEEECEAVRDDLRRELPLRLRGRIMKPTPSFMGRIVGFTVSMAEWLSDGCPLRDPTETRELFETHCKGGDGPPCPKFIPNEAVGTFVLGKGSGFCAECGCVVSDDPTATFNKVNKPFKGCPLKKWLPIVEIPEDATD
jgi:hypothetical protein